MDRRCPALQKGTSREHATSTGGFLVGGILLPPFRGHKIERGHKQTAYYKNVLVSLAHISQTKVRNAFTFIQGAFCRNTSQTSFTWPDKYFIVCSA